MKNISLPIITMSVELLADIYDTHITTELKLNNRKLSIFPSQICQFINLKELHLRGNHITNIPTEISNLVNLRILALSYNNLISLPDTIVSLPKLKTLSLRNNNITSLPESIGKLANLEHLSLDNNNLTSLPNSIGDLTNLRVLILTNNKLKSVPREILKLKKYINIDVTSYEIDNLDPDYEFIMLTHLRNPITNLPIGLKEIWVSQVVDLDKIKVPIGFIFLYIKI